MKTLFLVNERSGLRRRRDIAGVIRAHAGATSLEHEIVACGRIEDLDDVIARAEREKFDVVYAVGGDGTVHEVARRLIGRDLAFAVLPTGSGNGYARHLRLPINSLASLQACLSGSVVRVDTAQVNGRPFLGVMGVGLDAVVAQRFASSDVRGLRTYVKEGLKTFMNFRPERYEIVIDNLTMTTTAYLVAVANSSQYGNNARIAPVASLQDGLLDLVLVEDLSIFSAPRLLMRLFMGTLHRSSRVKVVQGRDIVIRRERAGPVHLDGEPLDMEAELKVKVVPLSLNVLLPKVSQKV